MTESSAATKRRLRRIPEELRKRNAQSCDRCRKRRCKCVPSSLGPGCVTCRDSNVDCSYTAPRKMRFYGSVDDLSPRYRCLEALVKGAFPDEALGTVDDLVALGKRKGYQMPDLSDANRQAVKIEELIRGPRNVNAFSDKNCEASVAERSKSHSEEPQASMVRDPLGREHYIGPSGTLNFLSQLRKLVVNAGEPNGEPASQEDTAKFTLDNTAQALEVDEREAEAAAPSTEESTPQDGHSPGSITSSIAREFTRLPTADMDEILRQFPPSDVLELLIDSYFKNVHDDFPLFHRASFEDEYEIYIIQARRPPQLAQSRQRPLPDWGWIGSLHMMIVFGSITNRSLPNVDHAALRRTSVAVARSLLPQFISRCSLSNVRVLLLLALFLHNNNERNAAWNLVGTATRISFALGLHRSDMNSSFRPLEREVRKWIFCTLYSFEQFLASSLGRPSGLQEADVEIVAPREGFVDGGGGADARLVSWSLKLQGILSKTRLLHLGKSSPSGGSGPTTIEDILQSLAEWKREIGRMAGLDLPWIRSSPTGLLPPADEASMEMECLKVSLAWKTRAQLRSVLLVHIQFHYIAIVATRPVLLRDIALIRKSAPAATSMGDGVSPKAALCVKHASQLAHLVLLLDHFDLVNGLSGLDVFYAYCAAMILLLRLLGQSRVLRTGSAQSELRDHLNNLMSMIRGVINRTDKSGSMKRFARVVDKFADCVNSTTHQSPGSVGIASQGDLQGAMAVQSNAAGPSASNDYGQAGNSNPGMVCSGPMEGLLDFLPLSGFGNMGTGQGQGQGESWASSLMGNMDITMPEWSDMGLLLAGYGETV